MKEKPSGFGGMLRALRFIGIAVALILIIPRVVVGSIVNAAEWKLTRELVTGHIEEESWFHALLQTLDWMEPLTVAHAARQSVGYASLVSGDLHTAADAWHIPTTQPDQLPSVVAQRYLQEEHIPSQIARDTIAHGYIQNAEADLTAGNLARARSSLEAILQLRPADLYAHFQLRQIALDDGEVITAQQHTDALQNYAIEAIAPSVDLLIPSVEQILPTLLDEQIWDYAEAQRAVALIVWRYSSVDETVLLLDSLAQRYPNDASWPFYLGELYQRRQDWQQAEQEYVRALAINPAYAPAYLRLGILAEQVPEETAAGQERAMNWYRQYLQRVPDDPVGQQRLAALAARMGTVQDAPLAAGMEHLKDDRYLVSTLLGVSPDTIALGDNLLGADDFRPDTAPNTVEDWTWNVIAGLPEADQALFTGGQDTLEAAGNAAVRVDGLWLRGGTGAARARAGFRHSELSMPPDAIWLVVFSYSASAAEEGQGAAVWLTPISTSGYAGEMFLPPTSATWRREAILIHNRTGQPVRLIPQLRNWSMQSVWFDHVAVRPVTLDQDVTQRVPGRLTTWQLP